MKTKIRFAALVLALVSVFTLLAGCNETAKTPAATDVTSAVMKGQKFPEMVALTEKTMTAYYGIDPNLLEDWSVLVTSSGATADEVAVFRLKDEKTAASVKKLLQTRCDDQRAGFEGYVDSEVPRIEAAVIGQQGAYLYLLICSDTAAAQSAVKAML